jgi:7,8-dihydropterin-6-yl-methyl-4-(beta-D-ribofuranosyl)aminobenzene 5'-phosphate synthase
MARNIALLLVGALAWGCGESAESPAAKPLPPGNWILNLYDAFGPERPGTVQDFGFSALIRYRGKTILFDAGTSAEILKKNVEALGIDLRQVDFAVASHSHFDHISGFDYVLSIKPDLKIYFPFDMFWGATFPFDATGTDPKAADDLPKEQRYFGGGKTKFPFRSSGRFWKANVEFIKGHHEIAPGINLIFTESPFLGYFNRYPNLSVTGQKDDSASPLKRIKLAELSLSLDTERGDALVVGCSHSLVHVITRAAKEHCKRDVAMVMGGFHLLPYKEPDIRGMAQLMRDELGVKSVAPAHCTGHLGFKVFREEYGDRYKLAGLGVSIPLPE